MCVCVCLDRTGPRGPDTKFHVKTRIKANNTFFLTFESLPVLIHPLPSPCPKYLVLPSYSSSLSAPPWHSGECVCVAEIAAGAWGPPRLLSAVTPRPGSTQTGQSAIKSLSVATNSIQPLSLGPRHPDRTETDSTGLTPHTGLLWCGQSFASRTITSPR